MYFTYCFSNFSRTLNKVKTEQEVWTLIPSSSSFDSVITESINSSYEKQFQSNRSVSMSLMESYTTSGETSNSIKSKSNRINPLVYVTDSTKINSPSLTDAPLVLLNGTSHENPTKTHSTVNLVQKHIISSICSS